MQLLKNLKYEENENFRLSLQVGGTGAIICLMALIAFAEHGPSLFSLENFSVLCVMAIGPIALCFALFVWLKHHKAKAMRQRFDSDVLGELCTARQDWETTLEQAKAYLIQSFLDNQQENLTPELRRNMLEVDKVLESAEGLLKSAHTQIKEDPFANLMWLDQPMRVALHLGSTFNQQLKEILPTAS